MSVARHLDERRSERQGGLGVLLVGLMATGLGACGRNGEGGNGEADCSGFPTAVVEERPVDVAYRGPTLDVDALVAESTPRLVVQVTNSEPSVERVRLTLDGKEALDVDLPAGGDCRGGHNPVFSVAYDRPSGLVEAELHIQGSSSTTTISVPASGTAWAVIDIQSKREWGDIAVYETRPMWG